MYVPTSEGAEQNRKRVKVLNGAWSAFYGS